METGPENDTLNIGDDCFPRMQIKALWGKERRLLAHVTVLQQSGTKQEVLREIFNELIMNE